MTTARLTNNQFSTQDSTFRECCTEAGVKNTKRQASKYRLGRGSAFKQLARVRRSKIEDND